MIEVILNYKCIRAREREGFLGVVFSLCLHYEHSSWWYNLNLKDKNKKRISFHIYNKCLFLMFKTFFTEQKVKQLSARPRAVSFYNREKPKTVSDITKSIHLSQVLVAILDHKCEKLLKRTFIICNRKLYHQCKLYTKVNHLSFYLVALSRQ